MRILIDVNLSPLWVTKLEKAGYQVTHWSEVGKLNAEDLEIFKYARINNLVVFTHDLDFGDVLAVTNAEKPSVIQLRTNEPIPEIVGNLVINALKQFEDKLEKGALITISPKKMRARILPINDKG